MYAIASLLIVVALSLLITRVGTVVLVATGMSGQAARFQARSAFTGTGFTTSESDQVVEHPVRRRVVMVLMLLGNAGIVASVSSLILSFKSGGTGAPWLRIVELAAGLMVLVYGSRSPWLSRRLASLVGRFLRRYTDLEAKDVGDLLDLADGYAVSELAVREGDWVAGRTLVHLALREEGVAVLGITQAEGGYVGAPVGTTRVDVGDVLVLYGRSDLLTELDHRPAGAVGDGEHARAVQQHLHQIRADVR